MSRGTELAYMLSADQTKMQQAEVVSVAADLKSVKVATQTSQTIVLTVLAPTTPLANTKVVVVVLADAPA